MLFIVSIWPAQQKCPIDGHLAMKMAIQSYPNQVFRLCSSTESIATALCPDVTKCNLWRYKMFVTSKLYPIYPANRWNCIWIVLTHTPDRIRRIGRICVDSTPHRMLNTENFTRKLIFSIIAYQMLPITIKIWIIYAANQRCSHSQALQ